MVFIKLNASSDAVNCFIVPLKFLLDVPALKLDGFTFCVATSDYLDEVSAKYDLQRRCSPNSNEMFGYSWVDAEWNIYRRQWNISFKLITYRKKIGVTKFFTTQISEDWLPDFHQRLTVLYLIPLMFCWRVFCKCLNDFHQSLRLHCVAFPNCHFDLSFLIVVCFIELLSYPYTDGFSVSSVQECGTQCLGELTPTTHDLFTQAFYILNLSSIKRFLSVCLESKLLISTASIVEHYILLH